VIGKIENPEKYSNKMHNFKYECKKCGRKAIMPKNVDKVICRWCRNFVFKNSKDEFEYRIKSELLKRR